MGTRAREILEVDRDELINLLNKAFADEWLAYYQYWIGAKVIKGVLRGAVSADLVENADEELKHAHMLADRIIQLGGTPLLSPQKWLESAECQYKAPEDHHVVPILNQNLAGERCAIDVYKNILKFTEGKDYATYNIVMEILDDELEHEEELQAFLEDIEMNQAK